MEEKEKIIRINIWNKECNIKIIFEKIDGKNISQLQIDTYKSFIENQAGIFYIAYAKLREYLISNFSNKVKESNFDIFSYIVPSFVYFPEPNKEFNNLFGLGFYFKFDMKKDYVLYFNEKDFIKIDSEKNIL